MPQISAAYPATPGQQEVDRVICASRATDTQNVYATLEAIRDRALHHNPQLDIHAALMYQSGWFLHWAEGPHRSVAELFGRIAIDKRHHQPHVVHASTGRRLLMTPWSMLLSSATESADGFGRRVLAIRDQIRAGSQLSPTTVIRRLVLPMRLPGPEGPTPADAYYRVVVCAASGQGAFDLTHWLSETQEAPRESRRTAGPADRDSASDYVDFMLDDKPCRVVAVARTALTQGLQRSMAPEWHFLVLLFDGDARRDEALLDRVAEIFDDAPRRPPVLAITPEPADFLHVQQQAQARGFDCLDGGHMSAWESPSVWQSIRERLRHEAADRSSIWPLFPGALPG